MISARANETAPSVLQSRKQETIFHNCVRILHSGNYSADRVSGHDVGPIFLLDRSILGFPRFLQSIPQCKAGPPLFNYDYANNWNVDDRPISFNLRLLEKWRSHAVGLISIKEMSFVLGKHYFRSFVTYL